VFAVWMFEKFPVVDALSMVRRPSTVDEPVDTKPEWNDDSPVKATVPVAKMSSVTLSAPIIVDEPVDTKPAWSDERPVTEIVLVA